MPYACRHPSFIILQRIEDVNLKEALAHPKNKATQRTIDRLLKDRVGGGEAGIGEAL